MTESEDLYADLTPLSCAIAGILAWVVPGLGHLYLGRRFKGIAFTLIINAMFLSGWVMSEGEAMSLHEEDGHRYAFLGQVGAGGPTLASLAYTHWPELLDRSESKRADRFAEREARYRTQEYIKTLPWLDTGLLYCMVAGLLNMLVVYDAATGGLGLPPEEEDEASEEAAPAAESGDPPKPDAPAPAAETTEA